MEKISFQKRLKEVRVKYFITQEKFGESIGRSMTIVNQWEKGKASPSMETLILISQKFNINLNWLLLGEGEMIKEDFSKNQIEKIPDDIKVGIFKYPDLQKHISRYLKVMDGLGDHDKAKIKWNIEFD